MKACIKVWSEFYFLMEFSSLESWQIVTAQYEIISTLFYIGNCIFIIYVIKLFTKFKSEVRTFSLMSFFRWSLCLRVRSMSPGPAPASPWPPQPPPGPAWTKLVCISTCVLYCTWWATRPLLTSETWWPRGLSSSRLLPCDKTGYYGSVQMYTALNMCTLLSRRDCLEPACESPMLSQEKLVSRTETKPGSTQSWVSWNRQVNQTFCVWVSCEWYGV